MTRRWILSLIAAGLVGLGVLVFVRPQLMISPGPLAPAHAALTTDCFACHTPLRGASPARCTACHAIADIGLRTTKGVDLASPHLKAAFHRQLATQDCMACHTGHEGSVPPIGKRQSFSHQLLTPSARAKCETCHTPPPTNVHRDVRADCGQCHSQDRWKPANFDHTKLFLLEGPHNAACTTCHIKNDTSRYTCFGCHEHQPDAINAIHRRKGIQNFENCVQCHRSAEGEEDD